MTTELFLPKKNFKTWDYTEIKSLLADQGVQYSRWHAQHELNTDDTQDTILKAYQHELEPFMKSNGFQSADVINVNPKTPDVETIRQKFIKEHTHSEDEVRFFVDGSGVFWFNFDNGVVARITCTKGDFLSVPKGTRHWFDLAPTYFVKAIRIFSNKEGWVAQYTGSGVDTHYANIDNRERTL